MNYILVDSPFNAVTFLRAFCKGPITPDVYPTLFATDSDELSIENAPPQLAMTLGFQITRDLSDYEYANLAQLAYKAMRHSLGLIRFPNTIISVPDHDHTPPVTIGG